MNRNRPERFKLDFSIKEQNVCDLLEELIFEKPSLFDQRLFEEFKLLSATKDESFFEFRTARHLVKLISVLSYLKWKLINNSEVSIGNRQSFIRFIPSVIVYPFGTHNVLGIVIGLRKKNPYERLGEAHIIKAFQKLMKGVEVVRGAFYCNECNHNQHTLSYVELRKSDGKKFSTQELSLLKRELLNSINDHIETLVPSVFNIRNEEEIGKALFVLNRELSCEKDIPQLSIFYEGQSTSHLIFTAVCLYTGDKQVDVQIINQKDFHHISARAERRIIAGYLRNNIEKKAVVITLFYEINPGILRNDFSINLLIVREQIVSFLMKIFGEFRDYNGGLYFRQNQLLKELKANFINQGIEDFLEKFFYSIFPIENQATMNIDDLVFFVELLRNTKEQNLEYKKNVNFHSAATEKNLAIAIKGHQKDLHDLVVDKLLKKFGCVYDIIFTKFKMEDLFFTGVLLNSSNNETRESLKSIIKECILQWRDSFQNIKTLNLSIANTPISLDPRRGGEEVSSTVLRFLFEGLMKIGMKGEIEYGIATHVSISKDQRRYVFLLREAYWSNGESITAEDFVYSWTKILSPNFFTPFSYLFYPIKNGKSVKEGSVTFEALGIKALNEKTLQVELEKPITYFLELLTHNVYSPVPKSIDSRCPNWENLDQSLFICNGPFIVEHQAKDVLIFKKNEYYWNSNSIFFDKVFISKYTNSQALRAFEKGEIDWLGAPLHPWDVTFHIKNQKKSIKDAGSSEVLWIVNNVTNPYLANTALRKALAYAIDRREILKRLGHQGFIANSILPRIYSRYTDSKLDEGDIDLAKALYEEVQREIGRELPKFTLYTSHGGIREKIAVAVRNQWEERLGFICKVQRMEWKDLFKLMVTGDFQLATTMWKPLFNDPMYTLNVFESKTHPVNFSNWESDEFQEILSKKGMGSAQRLEAEQILLQDFPIIPLIYEEQCFIKSPKLNGFRSNMGRIDFSGAYYEGGDNESIDEVNIPSIL